MKLLLIVFFFLPFGTICQVSSSVNSFQQVNATLNYFLDQVFFQKTALDSVFLPTFDDLVLQFSVEEEDLAHLATERIGYLAALQKTITEFREKLNFPKYTIVDTLTYRTKEDDFRFLRLNVYVSFQSNSSFWWFNDPEESNELFSFIIMNDQLQFLNCNHLSSAFVGKLDRFSQINSAIYKELNTPVRNSFAISYNYGLTTSEIIPFRKKGKWGLKSAEGKIRYPAKCDEIYAYESGYYLVKIGGKYNLVNAEGKTYFTKNVDTILPGNWYFYALEKPPLEPLTFYSYKNRTSCGELNPESGAPRYKAVSGYVYSVDKEGYSPIRPYLDSNDLSDKGNPFAHSLDLERLDWVPFVRKYSPRYFVLGKLDQGWLLETKNDTISLPGSWESLEQVGNHLYAKRNDSTFVLKPDGTIVFQTAFYSSVLSAGSIMLYDFTTNLKGLYIPEFNVELSPQFYSITPNNRDNGSYMVITKDKQLGFLDKKGTPFFD